MKKLFHKRLKNMLKISIIAIFKIKNNKEDKVKSI